MAAPKGIPRTCLSRLQFAEGWQIPEPDKVIYIQEKPVKVAAQGTLPYRYFIVDPFFKEDKWIKAIEARPGNRSVVHHIIVGFVKPKQSATAGVGRGCARGICAGHAAV